MHEGHSKEGLVCHEQAAGLEQLGAVSHRVPHERRGVQAIRGDDQVALGGGEPLHARIGVDVEQRVLDEAGAGEPDARLAEEDLGDVGEDVTAAGARENWQDARCGATGAGADLEGNEALRAIRKER